MTEGSDYVLILCLSISAWYAFESSWLDEMSAPCSDNRRRVSIINHFVELAKDCAHHAFRFFFLEAPIPNALESLNRCGAGVWPIV